MNKQLEEARSLGLAINHTHPRLFSAFGDNIENIINAVELESTGAKMVLKSHYDKLPFISKPATYWEDKKVKVGEILWTQFMADYMSWTIMLGIRNLIDEFSILDLKTCILEEFNIHNEESVRTAIKMNLRGDFGEIIEAFGQFNRIYFTKIMSQYEKKLLRDHKRAIEIRNKLIQPIELSEEEKEELLKKEIQKVYNSYVVEIRNDIELISYVMYDYLDRIGKISLDKMQKDKLMNDARIELLMIPKNKYTIHDLDSNKSAKQELVVIAKRIAVKNYFNALILNKIETIF